MNSDLIVFPPSTMPTTWRDAIATARKAGEAETVIQLVIDAGRRGLDSNGWTVEHAARAITLLHPLPRSATRVHRLEVFARRITREAKQAADQKEKLNLGDKLRALKRTLSCADVPDLPGLRTNAEKRAWLNSLGYQRRDMGCGVFAWVPPSHPNQTKSNA
jgi:hypothetical protein